MDWKRRLKQKGRKKKKLHTKIPTSKGRHVTVSNLVEALWGTNCPRYGNNLVIGPHVGIVLVCKACIGQDGVTAVLPQRWVLPSWVAHSSNSSAFRPRKVQRQPCIDRLSPYRIQSKSNLTCYCYNPLSSPATSESNLGPSVVRTLFSGRLYRLHSQRILHIAYNDVLLVI